MAVLALTIAGCLAQPAPSATPATDANTTELLAQLQEHFYSSSFAYDFSSNSSNAAPANYSFTRFDGNESLYFPQDDNTTAYVLGEETFLCKTQGNETTCAGGDLLSIDPVRITLFSMGGPYYYLTSLRTPASFADTFNTSLKGNSTFLGRPCQNLSFENGAGDANARASNDSYWHTIIESCFDDEYGFALTSTFTTTTRYDNESLAPNTPTVTLTHTAKRVYNATAADVELPPR
ncbi:hypothetical protein AUJ14_04890 [Candidatus Micrarchaeota archaeon CG1_02_55_22]|nr:MAG: hypothetical protein AUJ14_04890 [Candidatus Micrarchaeota archaeon CG1_02_55_22]